MRKGKEKWSEMKIRLRWNNEERYWMNPDNLLLIIRKCCPNTEFQCEYLIHPSKEVKVYLGKESFEHRDEMRDDDKQMSPEDQAIYWMNKGREKTLDQGDLHEFIERIERLEKKLNEIIEKVNYISDYYECKGDYAGIMTDLEDKL